MKILTFLLSLLAAQPALGNIYVVVGSDSHLTTISKMELADVYLGRKKEVNDVYINQVLDRVGPPRQTFFLSVTNMYESQINAYWAKLKFSGRMRAPEPVGSEQQLAEKLSANPNAIGYTLSEPLSELRTVLIIYD